MMTINKSIMRKQDQNPKPLGLYLHIPFCTEKCNYCDFLSFGGVGNDRQGQYVNALVKEIEYYGKEYHNKYYVDTIFIGGGTPSILEVALIAELMAAVRANFHVLPDAEITMESNPKTLNRYKLNRYFDLGINRLSIGAQSLDNDLLAFLGRIHRAEDFLESYQAAREAGFQNINTDLMFGIPGQNMECWLDTLKKVLKLMPEHISFYSLQIEEGTPFFKMYREGRLEPIDDDADRDMYHRAVELFYREGYHHYEISNCGRPGYECRHNLKYWSMDEYLGLGLGAHSYLEGARFSNAERLSDYVEAGRVSENKSTSPFIVWYHKNSRQEDISEYLFTGLRKREGIDLDDFEAQFQQPIEEIYADNWHRLKAFIESGYLVKTENRLYFTKQGIDISNTILTEFV
jgi:oxygen-independent coproporphyrinogen-3 oxidase